MLLDEVAQPCARALVLEVCRAALVERGDEGDEARLFARQNFSKFDLLVGKGEDFLPLFVALDFLRRAFVAVFVVVVEEVEQRVFFELEDGGILCASVVCLCELERREPLYGGRLSAEQTDVSEIPALRRGVVRRLGSVEGGADFFVLPFSHRLGDLRRDVFERCQQRFSASSQRLHPSPSGLVVLGMSEDEGGFVQRGIVAGSDPVERRAVDEDVAPVGVGVLSCAKNFDFGVVCHDARMVRGLGVFCKGKRRIIWSCCS